MYEILPESSGHIVALKAIGHLTDADFDTLVPEADRMIDEAAPTRVFLDWSELEGWDRNGESSSSRFWLQNAGIVERVAVIAHERLLSDVVRLRTMLGRADVRRFPASGADQAWAWLRSSPDP